MEEIYQNESSFIKNAINSRAKHSIYLLNGICLKGVIESEGVEHIIMKGSLGSQLIFKHAISTISLVQEG